MANCLMGKGRGRLNKIDHALQRAVRQAKTEYWLMASLAWMGEVLLAFGLIFLIIGGGVFGAYIMAVSLK